MSENDDRAASALKACEAFAELTGQDTKEELEDVITDLIANLLHLCDRHGLYGEDVIERGAMHYDWEIEDDENEEDD